MQQPRKGLACMLIMLMLAPQALFAANHREAPITALDRLADVTDWYTFVSYDRPDHVTMILNVDPLLEPGNGPNYFPFDPNILYEMKVDNNRDGKEDVIFQFRFRTEVRAPGVFTALVGGIAGIPQITSLDGAGSEGLNLRQSYTVTMIRNGKRTDLTAGKALFAVPSNVGPRTMPNYSDPGGLYEQGIYTLSSGARVFAGTVEDPFYIDLGATFDSLNFRVAAGGGVLSPAQDANDVQNYASDTVSGFNVNSIALEVPISWLTVDGKTHTAGEKEAVIGTYATTSRPAVTVRRSPKSAISSASFRQVQRMGNPLINELLIGTGSKDRFSMDDPKNDAQFANFLLQPLLADVFASVGIPVPAGPRTDLLPLVQYKAPICPGCGANDAGPIADLLRLNTGIAPTPFANQKRLAFLTALYGDPSPDLAGFPNGRRLIDDVTDIASRAVGGILKDPAAFGTRIGDGVNVDDAAYRATFPYVAPAHSGRDRRHVDPGEPGCLGTCPAL
jgi:hypothetical protein